MQLTINDHDAVSSAAVVVLSLSLNPSIHTHTAAAAAAEAAAKEAKFNKKEAESIADDLKHHDLADGNYYSSHDIEAIIK